MNLNTSRHFSLSVEVAESIAFCCMTLLTFCFTACSQATFKLQSYEPISASKPSSNLQPASAVDVRQPSLTNVAAISDPASDADRLAILRRTRLSSNTAYDFAIGPGDIIEISVPGIEDLKNRSVRVSGDNSVGLPLIGVIDVSGMTEAQLRNALTEHLRRYMRNPQIDVFVKTYRTRQIAISGAVRNPGVYTLASPSDTILEMISRAGGLTEDASPRIILIPAIPPQNVSSEQATESTDSKSASMAHPVEVASLVTVPSPLLIQPAAAHAEPMELPRGISASTASDFAPVVIDVSNINSQKVLDLPARPGDVVIVPPAGQVVVQGWVQNPGAYKISSGMTALGAVGAAGGALFSKSAEILRTGSSGERIVLPVDFSDGQNGKNAALPVQAGDVLIVRRSVTGSVPYFFYLVFTKFGTGMYLPPP
jgi:protein involved in polysaccharide export with SLBB domain